MNTQSYKTPENKSLTPAKETTQNLTGGEGKAQFADNRPETAQLQQLQGMANDFVSQIPLPIQKKKNDTGLPDQLKSGIENLSGISMDDVKVHRNSNKPAQLNAHAYAQGTDIHLASGQEKHLPHEAWHVVQQKQGRVKPTKQLKSKVSINDDVALEKEADVMGEKALALPIQPDNLLEENVALKGKNAPKQFVVIVDEETGEELEELTIEDLIARLPRRVQGALMTLPSVIQSKLADLPLALKLELLDLDPTVQLEIIRALHRLGPPQIQDRTDNEGAIVPVANTQPMYTPEIIGDISPGLVDFLFRDNPFLPRNTGIPIQKPPTMGQVLAIEGPPVKNDQPEPPELTLPFPPRMDKIERQLFIQHARGRSQAEIHRLLNLIRSNPNLSVTNVVHVATLPAARDGEIPQLLERRPSQVSVSNLINLAIALPHLNLLNLVPLANLFPLRSIQEIVVLGGGVAHRSGQDLAWLASRNAGLSVAEIITLAGIPVERSLLDVETLCRNVSPARTAIDLAYLAANINLPDVTRFIPCAELPGVQGFPAVQIRSLAIAFNRHTDLLVNVIQAQAAISTVHINFSSNRLRTIIEARNPENYANLMTILNWGFYTDFQNMERIVGHIKIDSLARLLDWLGNPNVNDGNRLYTILQNYKIEGAADVDHLLYRAHGGAGRYNLQQISQWLAQNWASRAAGNKVAVNGRVPVAQIPGTGGTPGQKYTPNQVSAAYGGVGQAGRVYHLSMSFNIGGPPVARVATFTGLHVSWRPNGADEAADDPRLWFNVNNGVVTNNGQSGAFPGGALGLAMVAEGMTLMRGYLPRLNCYI